MNKLITILFLSAIVLASTVPDVVIVHAPATETGFLGQVWSTVNKYYRVAQRKFNCFMWGKECHRSHPTTLPKQPAETDWNETVIENTNWLEKRLPKPEDVELKHAFSKQQELKLVTKSVAQPALANDQSVPLPKQIVPVILPKKN